MQGDDTKTVEAGGAQIHYEDVGSGETVLLGLPGWCSARSVFAGLTPHLRDRHRLLLLDWPGHGASSTPAGDFGFDELVAAALAVIADSRAESVVPVAVSHAGWVALELRRRLAARVPRIVCIDWLVLDPPPPFCGALEGLQDPARWAEVRERLFGMWLGGGPRELAAQVRDEMTRQGFDMWRRAGREIARLYGRYENPLRAAAALEPPPALLHLYAQPADPGYLAAQRQAATAHPWFEVERLEARTHFPLLEVPEATARSLERFLELPADTLAAEE